MEVGDARKLKALADENAKLKKLLAEAMLGNAVLKDLNSNKWLRPLPGGKSWLKSPNATR